MNCDHLHRLNKTTCLNKRGDHSYMEVVVHCTDCGEVINKFDRQESNSKLKVGEVYYMATDWSGMFITVTPEAMKELIKKVTPSTKPPEKKKDEGLSGAKRFAKTLLNLDEHMRREMHRQMQKAVWKDMHHGLYLPPEEYFGESMRELSGGSWDDANESIRMFYDEMDALERQKEMEKAWEQAEAEAEAEEQEQEPAPPSNDFVECFLKHWDALPEADRTLAQHVAGERLVFSRS
jgi:phage-related protein